MAIRESREIVIEAPLDVIMNALTRIDEFPQWSRAYKHAEVLDTYADGRPHHVMVRVKVLKRFEQEVLELHWGPDWMAWDADATPQQRAQHAEFNLKREGLRRTRVRFAITVEPTGPYAALMAGQGAKILLNAGTYGLRNAIMGQAPPFA